MKLSFGSLIATALLTARVAVADAHQGVLELHGSGTTNPSKCYWNIMEELTEQAGTAVRMSYRAVGSSTGIEEFRERFVNPNADLHVMFGSGDIPIPKETFEEINEGATNGKFVHLPVVAGAVSFFHSIPDTPHLNLTACVLGQIYNQKLSFWGDEPIAALNPDLSNAAKQTRIRVARRVKGSSSTASITAYLHKACDDENLQLPAELVGALPEWPESPADNPELMVPCYGSGGMATCIDEVPGTIGYLEVGHGISTGLDEVRLHNRDAAVGTTQFRNSQESNIEAAISMDAFPSSPDEDFSSVSFIDRGGADTWPIVLMTYIYVRKDLSSFISSPQEQALLVAFLRALYMPDYLQRCADEYGFILFLDNAEVKQFAEDAISMVEASIDYTNATKFVFETEDTMAITGAAEYVFSQKRREISDVERDDLQEELASLLAQIEELTSVTDGDVSQSAAQGITSGTGFFSSSDETQLKAALALGSISFAFWTLWIAAYLYRTMTRSQNSSSSDAAAAARVSSSKQQTRDETGSNSIDEGGAAADAVAFG